MVITMTEMRTFKHRITGKVGNYPAHFEDNPDFIPCEPENCQDCKPEVPEETFAELPESIEEEEDLEW